MTETEKLQAILDAHIAEGSMKFVAHYPNLPPPGSLRPLGEVVGEAGFKIVEVTRAEGGRANVTAWSPKGDLVTCVVGLG